MYTDYIYSEKKQVVIMNSSYYKMNKTEKRILFHFLLLSFFFSSLFSYSLFAVKSEVSKIRMSKIASIIKEFTDAKEKLTDPFVQEAILDKVDSQLSLEPDEKPNEKGVSEIAREIRQIVSKRFPDSVKDIEAKAEKEALKKFKLKDKLEFVTIKVVRGEHAFSVSGIFYGYGIGGKSVRVGDNTPIAFFDLSDTDRAKFDNNFCKEKRKKYVEEKVRNYYKRKQSFLNLEFTEKLEKISKENEALGYIFVWNKWRTPKNVTEYLIQQRIRQQKKHGLDDPRNNDGIDPEVLPDDPFEITDPVEDPIPENMGENELALKIAKLKQKVEKWQMEIAGSQYGVDADQGFRKGDMLVLIGMTHDDVNFLSGMMGKGDTDSLSYPKGHIENVVFHYTNKILYKIVINYRIGPPEGMKLLLDSLHDAYGDSKEAKEIKKKEKERLARLRAIKKLCPKNDKGKDTHSWHKNGTCTKCKVKKTDLVPAALNKNLVETWKGNIIETQLVATLAADASNFTKFELTKKSLAIKEEQEKILEEERIRQAKEDKKRELQEYKDQLNK